LLTDEFKYGLNFGPECRTYPSSQKEHRNANQNKHEAVELR
jgi:hypothetical protein